MPGVRETVGCSLSACRMGIRRCWQFVLCHKPLILVVKDQYNILCLGLSGSGKSTLLAQLVGETTTDIEPTNGFNIKTLPIKDKVVSIKELGGSGRVQHFWNYYFADKNAILFVVNSSANEENLTLAKETLKNVLSHPRLKGRPCLVLGTHMDVMNNTEYFTEFFQNVLHGQKCRVLCCSSFNRQQVVNALEILIDLITINT